MRRGTTFLLTDRAVIPFLTAAYIAAGLVFVVTDYTLNDEGLLTHYWASWARQEFIPVFFYQRVRPVLSALYLPASTAGVHATLITHVIVASLSVPLLAAIARALGHRLPNLPALAVALSPLYLYGGPAGLSNTDGVVGMCLVLYLLCARATPLPAGLVAGLLPWVRFELAIFSAALAVYSLVSRPNRRMLVGMAVFPLLYTTAGAFYHHDPLWLLHFPASVPPDPWNPIWKTQRFGVAYFLEPLLALTPIAPVIMAVLPMPLKAIERLLLLYFVVAAVLLNVLPNFQIFGASPRYSMQLLPALALLAGRAFEPWWEGERPTPGTVVAVSVLAVWLATRQQDGITLTFLLIAYALLIAAASFQLRTTAAALVVGLMAVGPMLPIRREVGRSLTAPYLDPMVDWLGAHRDQVAGPILTNSQLLAPFLEDRLPGLDVRFVGWNDISVPLVFLTNSANGQRESIRRLSETDFYGRTLLAPISPEDFPPGTLLMLRTDIRLQELLPEALWGPRMQILEDTPQYRIARLLPAALERRTE